MSPMRNAYLIVFLTAAAVGASPSAQSPGGRVNLTGTVVVVNQQSDTVTLVDLKTMEAYRNVPVVAGPHEAAVSPDGRRVLVTNYNKRSEEHTSELQSRLHLVCRLLLEKKKSITYKYISI